MAGSVTQHRRRIRALIFDFDGLILDTEGPDYHSWLEVFQRHECSLPLATWAEFIGTSADAFDPLDHLAGQVRCELDRDEIVRQRRLRYHEMVMAEAILPGVESYLARAKALGLRTAVASSATRDWVEGHLARLGLDAHFECIRCAGDAPRVKPDPGLYQAALDALDVRPQEAIAFEDSLNGIRAARAAGIFCVAIPNPMTCELPLEEADLRIPSLEAMPLDELLRLVEE